MIRGRRDRRRPSPDYQAPIRGHFNQGGSESQPKGGDIHKKMELTGYKWAGIQKREQVRTWVRNGVITVVVGGGSVLLYVYRSEVMSLLEQWTKQ